MNQAMGRCAVFTEQFLRHEGDDSARSNLLGRVQDVMPIVNINKEDEEERGFVLLLDERRSEDDLRAVACTGPSRIQA